MACRLCPSSRRSRFALGLTVACTIGVGVVSCASGELPPRSANDPANPNAPETPMALASTGTAEENVAASNHAHVHGGTGDAGATLYTCPMHPDVVQSTPGACPKCGMQLRPKPGT